MFSVKNRLKNNDIAKSMVINGVCKPLSMILSYIYIPLAIAYLGSEKYGVWAVFLNISSWITSFDIGIGNGLRNKLTESISKNDNEKSRRLISSAYAILSLVIICISVVLIVIGLIIDWNALLHTNEKINGLNLVAVISVLSLAINLLLSLCNSVFFAMQKSHIVSVAGVISQTANLIVMMIIMKTTHESLVLVALISGLTMVLTSIVLNIVLFHKNSELMPSQQYVDFQLGKGLTVLGARFFIIQICALVLFSTDNFIVSHLYGADNVTPYSLVIKLYTAVILAHNAFIVPFWSASTKAKADKEIKKLKKMIRFLFLFIIPFIVLSLLIAIFFRPIMVFWLRKDISFSDDIIWLGFVYCVLNIWCNTIGTIASGLGIIKVFSRVAIVQALVNIPLSLFFAESLTMKSAGVLLGTILSMMISAVAIAVAVVVDVRKQEIENNTT